MYIYWNWFEHATLYYLFQGVYVIFFTHVNIISVQHTIFTDTTQHQLCETIAPIDPQSSLLSYLNHRPISHYFLCCFKLDIEFCHC